MARITVTDDVRNRWRAATNASGSSAWSVNRRSSFVAPSGADWAVSAGDFLVAFTLFLLFFEVLKAARNTARSIFDHVLSTLIFIGALVEFLLVPQAGTSTFAILLIIALVDVLGGWSVAVRTARRDFSIDPQAQ